MGLSIGRKAKQCNFKLILQHMSQLYLDSPMNQLCLDKAANQLYLDKAVNQLYTDKVGSQQCMDRVGSQPFTDRAGNQLCSDNILRNLPFLDKIVLVTDMPQRVNLLYSSKSTTIPTVTITNMLKQTSQLLSHLNPHISTPGDLHLVHRRPSVVSKPMQIMYSLHVWVQRQSEYPP